MCSKLPLALSSLTGQSFFDATLLMDFGPMQGQQRRGKLSGGHGPRKFLQNNKPFFEPFFMSFHFFLVGGPWSPKLSRTIELFSNLMLWVLNFPLSGGHGPQKFFQNNRAFSNLFAIGAQFSFPPPPPPLSNLYRSTCNIFVVMYRFFCLN